MIDIQRSYAPALAWFASVSELPSIPGFVVMELIQDAQNKQQVRKVLQMVAPLPIVWPTETDCARALSDFTAYHLSHKVGLIDALIAFLCRWAQCNSLYFQCETLSSYPRLESGATLQPMNCLTTRSERTAESLQRGCKGCWQPLNRNVMLISSRLRRNRNTNKV